MRAFCSAALPLGINFMGQCKGVYLLAIIAAHCPFYLPMQAYLPDNMAQEAGSCETVVRQLWVIMSQWVLVLQGSPSAHTN